MKIGFVFDDSLDKPDGVQQYILTLGQWYTAQGHEVHYLVGHTKRSDVPNIHSLSKNLQVQFNQNRLSTPLPASTAKIRQLLKREKFDVLHVQLPYSPFLAGRIIRLAPPQTALVGTFHILPFSRLETVATRALSMIVRRTRQKFDAVVSVSEPAQVFARQQFGMNSQVLPNAVPVDVFREGRTLDAYSDEKLTIVYLGRLVERKGCRQLLEALQLLHQKNKLQDVRVVIAGKGPLLPALEKFVEQHGLSRSVAFIGFVPEADKPDVLASATIAVLPSMGGESFGIVLVEAMAAGAEVVIAGDNPGYRTVMNAREEQIVDPRDTHAFADKLEYFIANANARKRAKAWQLRRAQEYDVAVVGKKLLQIYKEALRAKQNVR